MASKQYLEGINNYIRGNSEKIEYNNAIFEIMEGNLLKYVEEMLYSQLSPENAAVAIKRAAPINVWNKIVKKLSKLYAAPPTRLTENPADQGLIQYYEKMGIFRDL
jgi:hypothetical protein